MSEKNKKQKDQKCPMFLKAPPNTHTLIRKWRTQNVTWAWRGCKMEQLWRTVGDDAKGLTLL